MFGCKNGDIEEIGGMVEKSKKMTFLILVLAFQKHPNVGRILKKSFEGSIHTQLYMAIKDPFGRFQLQP